MEIKYQNNYRWVILSLIFLATTVNYLDRIVLSVLIPEIKEQLGIGDIAYSYILSAFMIMYTLGFLVAGRTIDYLGTKKGYLLSIITWSFSAVMHAVSSTAIGLTVWRGFLGITESGNFPAAIKSVSEWFKVKDRSFATALFNSGASFASIIGPPLITSVYFLVGWRWTFFVFGALGFILALIWFFFYKNPDQTIDKNTQENENNIPWRELLKHRESYGIMIGKFLTDPVWWFFLFWMPNYLSSERGFDLKEIAIAVPLIYIIAMILSWIGGWIPGYLIRNGYDVLKARKIVMLFSAVCMPISALAVLADNPWTAIVLVGLACGAHSSWSANIFTLVSDCFPSKAVGSVTGLAGFGGGLGGFLIASLAPGFIVTYFGYTPVFILMGVLHPLAYIIIAIFVKTRRIDNKNLNN